MTYHPVSLVCPPYFPLFHVRVDANLVAAIRFIRLAMTNSWCMLFGVYIVTCIVGNGAINTFLSARQQYMIIAGQRLSIHVPATTQQ
jgi:hypothetical protein